MSNDDKPRESNPYVGLAAMAMVCLTVIAVAYVVYALGC